MTIWGQLFSGRSPSDNVKAESGVGAASRFTPSFLRTEKTPAMEMVGSNPADSREKDNTAPVLREDFLDKFLEDLSR
jgi:hypothetical protein